MKFLLMSLSLLLLSCGEEPQEGNITSSLNELRYVKADENLSSSEKTSMSNGCSSLDVKESLFKRNIAGSGKSLNFNTQSQTCSGSSTGVKNVNFTVEEVAGKLRFEGTTLFADILTANSEILSDNCSKAQSDDDLARVVTLGTTAQWYYVLKSTDAKCNGVNGAKDQICLYVETGIKEANSDAFRIRDVDMYKIDINSSSSTYGMVIDRMFATTSGCSEKNQETIKRQTFLKFN